MGGDGCYWERLSGFGGTLDDVIANDFTPHAYPLVVEIKPTDAGFYADEDCGIWFLVTGPITSNPDGPIGEGTYIVGTGPNADMHPGTWRAPGGSSCYWERLSGFGGTLNEIIANDFGAINPVVTIAPTDAGFHSHNCGTWEKLY